MWVTRQDVYGMDKKVAGDLVSLGYTVLLTQRERNKNKVEEYPENGKDNLRNKLLMITRL